MVKLSKTLSHGLPVDLECSQMSVISSMSKFLHSIQEMNNTVLVPSKLMDSKLDGCDTFEDLYSIYSIINQLRDELTFGRLDDGYSAPAAARPPPNGPSSGTTSMLTSASLTRQLETREAKACDSDDGFSSFNSFSQSCSESSDEASDSDSEFGRTDLKELEMDAANYSSPQCLMNLFRLHLQGIQTTLNRFTGYAAQISEYYQKQHE